jgi:hypothetical protein
VLFTAEEKPDSSRGKKTNSSVGLNCTARQTNPKQWNALAGKVPESNEIQSKEVETSVALEARPSALKTVYLLVR